MADDQDRDDRRESLGPEYEAFEKRAMGLIRERRQAYEDSLRSEATAEAAPVPAPEARPPRTSRDAQRPALAGLRRWFTVPRVSYALNGLFLMLALVGWQFRTFFFPPEHLPLRVSGSVVSVLTPDEKSVIWARDFGVLVKHAAIAPWGHRKSQVVIAAGDANYLEARFAVFDFRNPDPDAAPLWTHTVTPEELKAFYPEHMTQEDVMWCNDFTFADIDGDGTEEIAALFHHQTLLPSCVRTLSKDGELLGTYYNWGYFEYVVAADLDGDGRDEIVASGKNNAPMWQGATFVLLDEDHLSGYSVDEGHPAPGLHDGSLARLILPNWDPQVVAHFGMIRLATAGLQVWEGSDQPRLRCKVGVDFFAPWQIAAGRQKRDYYVTVDLDAELNPISVLPHDGVLTECRRAIEAGEMTVPADTYEFWEEWLSGYRKFGALSQVP